MTAPRGNVGTGALEADARVDFAALRAARRERVLAEMERRGIDVLVLGREDNARYASGARRLWTAGTRPFGPGCLVVARTAKVHLLSTWDDGVPPEMGHDDLYGMTWNPALLIERLTAIEGVADAGVIGTDASSPSIPGLFAALAPGAALTDGESAMRAARRVKLDAEVRCIETACAIAEAAVSTLSAELVPGVTERSLVGRLCQIVTGFGVTSPASEASVRVLDGSRRRRPDQRVLSDGDAVAIDPMVAYAGYEGGLGRTFIVGGGAVTERSVLDRVIGACVPGATGADVLAARGSAQGVPVLRGVGMGYEPPVVSDRLGAGEHLEPGMVVSVEVRESGLGGEDTTIVRDVVQVTDSGPIRLSK